MADPVEINVVERMIWTRIRASTQIVTVGIVQRIKRTNIIHQRALIAAAALTPLACTVFDTKAVVSTAVSKGGTIASKWTPEILVVSASSSERTNIVRVHIVLEVPGAWEFSLRI
jgi:uncharacterized membrane protein YozB (DUF420 family)